MKLNLEKKEVILISSSFAVGLTFGILFKKKIFSLLQKLGMKIPGGITFNRPTSGPRSSVELPPKGKHPIQLYSQATPNGQKVTMALEEMGLAYDAYLINIFKEQQFSQGFTKVNPNQKIPAMIDYSTNPEGQRIFESGAILLYLAEKTGKLIPKDPSKRIECISWLFYQMGTGPFFGNFGHFYNYAPKSIWYDHGYSVARFTMEVKRLLDVLNKRLADNEYLVGDEFTIADCAWFPWVLCLETGYHASQYLELNSYVNINRWLEQIKQRPTFKLGMAVNSLSREEGKFQEFHTPV